MRKSYLLCVAHILLVLCTTSVFGQTYVLNEGFEGTKFPPDNWTILDKDADGNCWISETTANATIGGGKKCAVSYTVNPETYPPTPYNAQENYLITPQINVTNTAFTLSYKVIAESLGTGETYKILISTTGTTVGDFSTLFHEETIQDSEWDDYPSVQKKDKSLAEYNGKKIYIAFVHTGYDTYALGLDDVTIINQKGPKSVTGLTVTPGSKGALSATLSWTNPPQNGTGEDISGISIGIYRDNNLIKVLSENMTPGEKATYIDNEVLTGTHTYSVIAKTAEGESNPVSKSVYVGEDIPDVVNNLNAIIDNGKVIVTWEAPTEGINKGYINPDNFTYTIKRNTGTESVQVASNIKQLTFSENISPEVLYSYTVIPSNMAGSGKELRSNAVVGFADNLSDIMVGRDSQIDYYLGRVPTDLTYAYSTTETMYYPEDLNFATGEIKYIIYKNSFKSEIKRTAKIWMGETQKENLSEGWIPTTGMTLVYDGDIIFNEGVNDVPIQLTTPYNYQGGNLVVIYQDAKTQGIGAYFDRFYGSKTPDKADRSRAQTSSSEINIDELTNQGSKYAEVPQTRFVMVAEGVAKMEGLVKNNTTNEAIAGATITVPELSLTTLSDETGAYHFNLVRKGAQQFKLSAVGYLDLEESVTIPDNGKITKDFKMTPKATFTISGKVKANDTNANIAGAVIKVTGYADIQTTSGADGQFSLTGIYAGENYTLSIEYSQYDTYTAAVENKTADFNIGEITLQRSLIPVYAVSTTIDEGGVTSTIRWESPLSRTGDMQWTKIGDSDVQNSTSGDWSLTNYNVGHALDAATLETLNIAGLSFMKLKVYIKATEGTFTAKIWEGTKDDNKEIAAKVIDATQVSAEGSWITVTFDKPIEIRKEKNYLIGVNCKDASSSPIGTGKDYISGKNNLKWSDNPDDYVNDGYYSYNISVYCGIPGTEAKINPEVSAPKCSYNVYRAETTDLNTWIKLNASPLQTSTYTDNAWDELISGTYQYSVKAVYKTGESIEAYSEDIERSVDYDAGIAEFLSPIKTKDPQTNVEIKVSIKNFGEKPLTSIPVSYQVNGGTATSKTFEGNLAKGETAEFSLGTVDVTTLGTYEIKAFTQLENDGNPANDAKLFTLPNYADVHLHGYRWDAYGNAGIVSMHSNIPEQTVFIKEVTPDDALINAGEYFNGRFYAFTSTWYSEPRQFLVMDTLTWTPIKSAKTEDFMQDMAYDYASKEMYGIRVNGGESELVTINLENGEITSVASTGMNFHALACSKEGKLYGMSDDGKLYAIDKTTAQPDIIAGTGISDVAYLQSMAFDHNTGRLFWSHTGSQILGDLYEIDPKTAKVISLGSATYNDSPFEVVGLYSVYTHPTPPDNIEELKANDLKVYTDASKTIHVIVPFENEPAMISIISSVGTIVKTKKVESRETLINGEIPAGVYFVIVTTEKGMSYRLPFIVSK